MQQTKLDVKPGEQVAMRGAFRDEYHLYKITSVDGRGIITLENGHRYRYDGSPMEKGSKWNRPNPIMPVTSEIREAIERSNLAHKIARLDINHWKAMNIQTLREIARLADDADPSGHPDR